jgi:hypothetical protein
MIAGVDDRLPRLGQLDLLDPLVGDEDREIRIRQLFAT